MNRLDPMIKVHHRPHYYFNKIYSTAPNTWFHDLLDNGLDDDTPRYWHIFVGVNTRYLDVYPLQGKSNQHVRESLTWFIDKYKPEKLTSDNEPSFTSKATCDLCSHKNVKIFVITDKQHSSLGVIDRVIRTLRDMNTPKHPHEQSHDKEFLSFSKEKMRRLVNEYNDRYNSSLKCSPREMFNDKKKEIKFIHRMQKYRHVQRGIKDYELPVGTFVRYRMNKDPLTKHRYRYSPESYKVVGRDHGHYIIQAADGASLLMPRWRLIKSDVNIYPHKTQLDSKLGMIQRIVSHNPRTGNYNVVFEGSPDEYILTPSEIRRRTPQVMTSLERDYFARIGSAKT